MRCTWPPPPAQLPVAQRGVLEAHIWDILQIGSDHLDVNMDSVVSAMAALFAVITGHRPAFRVRNKMLRVNE